MSTPHILPTSSSSVLSDPWRNVNNTGNLISHNILKVGKDSFCLIENPEFVFETLRAWCSGFCFVGLELEWKSREEQHLK